MINESPTRGQFQRDVAYARLVVRGAVRRHRGGFVVATIVACFAVAAGLLVSLAAMATPDRPGGAPAVAAPVEPAPPAPAPRHVAEPAPSAIPAPVPAPVPAPDAGPVPAPGPEVAPLPTVGVSHVVAGGETLAEIATQYGVAYDRIAAASGIADPDHVTPGHILTVPPPEAGIHVVTAGDTFNAVAAELGVSPDVLAGVNPQITDRDLILVGSGLRVPAP